jgi:hypothetical protein
MRPEKQWHSFPKNIIHQNKFVLHCPTTFCPIQHHPAVSTTVLYCTCPAQARQSGNVPPCSALSCVLLHRSPLACIVLHWTVLLCHSLLFLYCAALSAPSCTDKHCPLLNRLARSCTVVPVCTVRSLLHHLAMSCTDMSGTVLHCPFCPAQPGTVLNCNKQIYEVFLNIQHRKFLKYLFFIKTMTCRF